MGPNTLLAEISNEEQQAPSWLLIMNERNSGMRLELFEG